MNEIKVLDHGLVRLVDHMGAAWDAAWTARDAAQPAAWGAAWDAARGAAKTTAWGAVGGAARAAAWDTARAEQTADFKALLAAHHAMPGASCALVDWWQGEKA